MGVESHPGVCRAQGQTSRRQGRHRGCDSKAHPQGVPVQECQRGSVLTQSCVAVLVGDKGGDPLAGSWEQSLFSPASVFFPDYGDSEDRGHWSALFPGRFNCPADHGVRGLCVRGRFNCGRQGLRKQTSVSEGGAVFDPLFLLSLCEPSSPASV